MGYLEACKKLGVEPSKPRESFKGHNPFKRKRFNLFPASAAPSSCWKSRALQFIETSHLNLLSSPKGLDLLAARGINVETVREFQLGWNQEDLFENRDSWGLPLDRKENGKERKQWLPKGIVIPSFSENTPTRIKVRRSEWQPNDKLPKYVEISGSQPQLSLYGNRAKPTILVESELDAILIQQFASDLCCCIALGGVGKRPDQLTHSFLSQSPLILLALDYDEAGKKEYHFWMNLYPHLCPWPARAGKSPGDSMLQGVDLRKWVQDGIAASTN